MAETQQPVGPVAPLSQEQITRLITLDAEFWWRNFAKATLLGGGFQTGFESNIMQRRAFAHYRKCRAQERPCLIQILKPRRKGASTVAEAICYHHMRKFRELRGTLMGNKEATSDKVFEMFRLFARADRYPWPDGSRSNFADGGDMTDAITLASGSVFGKETAGSASAGRSTGVQVFHGDEVAFFEDKTTGRDPMTAAMPTFFRDSPLSLGFVTSTPNGIGGWFYDTWIQENEWFKIFQAWFDFTDSVRPFVDEDHQAHFIEKTLKNEKSVVEMKLYNLSWEQMHWRQDRIDTDFAGDSDRFKQEYPSNDIECFLSSSRPRFESLPLKNTRTRTAQEDKNGRRGVIRIQGEKRAIYLPDDGGDVRIWEEPKLGCRYVLAVDTCRGKDQQLGQGTSADPDWHAAGVLRAAYLDEMTGIQHRPKLVALHRSRIEADVLAEIVTGMSWLYGGCITIPELNDGAGFYLVKELHKRHVPLFRREPLKLNKPGIKTEEEVLGAFGWNTDKATKKWIIDHLAPLIRDELIDLSDLTLQSELETFIVNKHGQAQAMNGKHDDTVMMLAIGMYNIGGATEYKPIQVRSVDLMRLRLDPRYMAPNGFRRV